MNTSDPNVLTVLFLKAPGRWVNAHWVYPIEIKILCIIIIITAMTKLTNEEKDDASMTEELRVCSTSDTIYMRAQL